VVELREAAAGIPDAKASRHMPAIALVLDGWSRDAAAYACVMDRQEAAGKPIEVWLTVNLASAGVSPRQLPQPPGLG
jgi:hypothetical protein